jgi:hypothetical protein
MPIHDIPRESWRDELDSFSRQHEGWLVSVTSTQPDGDDGVEAHDVPLQGVSPASPRLERIAIIVGRGSGHITHEVHHPTRLARDLTAEGATRSLLIEGEDGTTTRVEFRSPMRPEDVDGVPAPHGT